MEATTGSSTSSTSSSRRSQTSGSNSQALQTSQGATHINDGVVTKVAGIAAREVPGIYRMGGGAARALGSVGQAVGLGEGRGQGVTVEVGEEEAAVDLVVTVEYGESIPQVAQQVRDNVTKRIEGITGLRVTEVNIDVTDLHFPGDEQPAETPPPGR